MKVAHNLIKKLSQQLEGGSKLLLDFNLGKAEFLH